MICIKAESQQDNFYEQGIPDNKVHGVNMGPSGADRTQVGPMLAPWSLLSRKVHGANMGPSGADRTQVGPMLAPWTLLSGMVLLDCLTKKNTQNSFSSILLKMIYMTFMIL